MICIASSVAISRADLYFYWRNIALMWFCDKRCGRLKIKTINAKKMLLFPMTGKEQEIKF